MSDLAFSFATAKDSIDWNRYVSEHPQATPYHRWGWMQACEHAYNLKIKGLIARDSSQQIVGVVPSVQLKKPLASTGNWCSLPYCDTGYALADTPKIEQQALAFLTQQAAENKAGVFDYRGIANELPESEDALTSKKVSMRLPLPESADVLLASFKSKLRSQIRKAEKNGLTVECSNAEDFIDAFYSVYAINMRDLGSPVHHIDWFKAIKQQYGEQCVISIVKFEDKPVGAGIVLLNKDKACIPWASTVQKYNRLAPNMLLYWSLLAFCADAGVTEFDFGRSTYNEGTYKFKKQWGAQPLLLQWNNLLDARAEQDANGGPTSTGQLRDLVEKTWRKMPLGLTIKIGSMVRPYISL